MQGNEAEYRLTEKQKRFADEYLIDCNATQAAIRAGYSPKTAKQIGQENLTKPVLRAYITERMEEIRTKKTADAQEVLEYLTAVMRGEEEDETLRFVGDGYQDAVKLQVTAKDRLKAAELLGKRYGLFTEQVRVDMKPVTIIDDIPEGGEVNGKTS